MTDALLVAPIVVPLLAAGASALLRGRLLWQRMVTSAGLTAVGAVGVVLLLQALDGTMAVAVIGSHTALTGIALTADPFGAALVVATALLAGAAVTGMIGADEDREALVHPVLLLLLAGVGGSYIAGDLFTLFVLFELVMISSAVLLALHVRLRRMRLVVVYITVNLVGTTLLLAGIATLLAEAGTVNLALLGRQTVDAGHPGPLLVVVGFAVKAGLLPFTGWLALAYPLARRALLALFAGSLTTVGVAALYRVGLLAFDGGAVVRLPVLVLAATTAVVAALAALAATDGARVLALLVVTQVGFMVLGLGLGSRGAVAAGVVFILQDVLVKTGLVLAWRPLEQAATDARSRRLAVASFGVLALSLAGLPPLTGFVGKALLVEAAFATGAPAVAAAALIASALTLAALLRLWHASRSRPDLPPSPARTTPGSVAPAAVLAVAAVVVGILPQPLLHVGDAAADLLLQPDTYAEQVLTP